MKVKVYDLPSNRKFGFFFTIIFIISSSYFYYEGIYIWFYIFAVLSISFFIITLTKSEMLFPLNKLWMNFGLLLGMIVNPIVLFIIFFGMFFPISIIMRLIKRDELRIKLMNKPSYWVPRCQAVTVESFKKQF